MQARHGGLTSAWCSSFCCRTSMHSSARCMMSSSFFLGGTSSPSASVHSNNTKLTSMHLSPNAPVHSNHFAHILSQRVAVHRASTCILPQHICSKQQLQFVYITTSPKASVHSAQQYQRTHFFAQHFCSQQHHKLTYHMSSPNASVHSNNTNSHICTLPMLLFTAKPPTYTPHPTYLFTAKPKLSHTGTGVLLFAFPQTESLYCNVM